ncbi:MAG: BlaI/MecI/CopY family transcriptional regulator [Bacteroides sp.]|nr:BlaI/MecI/CopY family transcriptional regulator [Bacteroides sp.]
MERLTQQEEEIMLYFWRSGPSFIREIVNEMPEPRPPYTSVASVVRNLEKKAYLSPLKLGNCIQYRPQIEDSDYKRYFLGGVVRNYFTGSYKEMVSFFVRDRKLSKEELQELMDIIDKES